MKLSKKKSQELYNVVHEEIMQARIKIAKNPDQMINTKEVDNILSKLCYSAPTKACEIFK
jgi:hypothetical protein